MLAKEPWQINTIKVLDMVFEERVRQIKKHGEAMRDLPDGTGPEESWLIPFSGNTADDIQEGFREDYEERTDRGQLTRMHLVREELAEAFELDGDDPEFLAEIIQVAALCVQWAEYKLEVREAIDRIVSEQAS